MKHVITRLFVAGLGLASLSLAAESASMPRIDRSNAAEVSPWRQYSASFVFDFDVGNGIIPMSVGQRARVFTGDKLVLSLSSNAAGLAAKWAEAGHKLQWTKNGVPIEGATGSSYTVYLVDRSTAGLYSYDGAPDPHGMPPLLLEVGNPSNLDNLSSRFELSGSTPQITGLSIGGTANKTYLIRAVGPSLKPYGITTPAARPHLRYFDSKGKEITFAYAQVVIDWVPIFNSVGAFPLTGGEQEHTAFGTFTFAPGNYTVQVSDDAGQGGTVLLEMYELP